MPRIRIVDNRDCHDRYLLYKVVILGENALELMAARIYHPCEKLTFLFTTEAGSIESDYFPIVGLSL